MVSTTPLEEVSQLPNPDQLVELFVIDASMLTSTGGVQGPVFYIVPYPMDAPFPGEVVFNGQTYVPVPMQITGFLQDSQGTAPMPKMSVANIAGIFSGAVLDYKDMKGAQVTRVRTYTRYLDGMPEADPSIFMIPDIYEIDQKTNEDNTLIEWNLASPLDQQGIRLPGGLVLKDACIRSYRIYQNGAFSYTNVQCPYTGAAMYTFAGVSTSDPTQDSCGRKTSDCILRFGAGANLPTWAFPGVNNNAQG